MTSFFPASPTRPSAINSVTALCASERVAATTTPFPAAKPSAFITIGAPC